MARRRRSVVLADGVTISCYARSVHETHTVVVEASGHAYSYIAPNGALTRHLSPTALSAHRDMVRDAVALRNRFAWHTAAPHVSPYLHLTLTDSSEVRYQRRLRSTRARWPGSGEFFTDKLYNQRDACFELQSIEGLARVRLHGSGRIADIYFLSELKAPQDASEDADSRFAYYTSVHQTVTIECVPPEFTVPVDILLQAKTAFDNDHQSSFEFELKEGQSVMSSLPRSSAFAARPEFSAVASNALAAATGNEQGIGIPEISRVASIPSKWLYRRVVVEIQEDNSVVFMPRDRSSDFLVWTQRSVCERGTIHPNSLYLLQVYLPRQHSILSCRGEFFKWFDRSGRLEQQFTAETIPPADLVGLDESRYPNQRVNTATPHPRLILVTVVQHNAGLAVSTHAVSGSSVPTSQY